MKSIAGSSSKGRRVLALDFDALIWTVEFEIANIMVGSY